jgi:hypothetical protein
MMSVRTPTRIVSSRHGLSAAAVPRVTATVNRVPLTGATAIMSTAPSIGFLIREPGDDGMESAGNFRPTNLGMGGLRTSSVPSSRNSWIAPAIPTFAAR